MKRGAQKSCSLASDGVAHTPLRLNIKWVLFSFAPAKRSAFLGRALFGGLHKALTKVYVCVGVQFPSLRKFLTIRGSYTLQKRQDKIYKQYLPGEGRPLKVWAPIGNIQGSLDKFPYIHTYKEHTISFQTFFVGALLLIVHTWNSNPLRSNLLPLQSTCWTVPTTSGRPHGSPLV